MDGPKLDRVDLEKALAFYERCKPSGMTLEFVMLYRAAGAHLATLPKTKMIEVWHVEFWDTNDHEPWVAVCADKVIAEARALAIKGDAAICIRVTGPHMQCVPA